VVSFGDSSLTWRVRRRVIFLKNGVPTLFPRETARRMYHTTGFSKDEITELCAFVHGTGISSGGDGYPPMPSLFKSVVVTLTIYGEITCIRNWRNTTGCPSRRSPGDHGGHA
jgi:hypothetical protein